MSFRTIVISNKGTYLSYKNNCLLIESKKLEQKVSVPLEDIDSIIVESRDCILTSYLLSECSKNNILVAFCNDKHLPIGILTSFNSHSKQLLRIEEQFSQSAPFKKNLWKRIIKQKILNQSEILKFLEFPEQSNTLIYFSKRVKSGDKTNIEGQSARFYFPVIFGEDFTRETPNIINTYLNYTYTLVRASISRILVGYGFVPSYGIFHKNQYNNFNLADDFIEPLRPAIDLFCYRMLKSSNSLTPEIKIKLKEVLYMQVRIDNTKQTIINSIEISIKSYVSAIKNKNSKLVKLPSPIKEVRFPVYE